MKLKMLRLFLVTVGIFVLGCPSKTLRADDRTPHPPAATNDMRMPTNPPYLEGEYPFGKNSFLTKQPLTFQDSPLNAPNYLLQVPGTFTPDYLSAHGTNVYRGSSASGTKKKSH
jgi:hypothetical protein